VKAARRVLPPFENNEEMPRVYDPGGTFEKVNVSVPPSATLTPSSTASIVAHDASASGLGGVSHHESAVFHPLRQSSLSVPVMPCAVLPVESINGTST
jgi:hypothetical protein